MVLMVARGRSPLVYAGVYWLVHAWVVLAGLVQSVGRLVVAQHVLV